MAAKVRWGDSIDFDDEESDQEIEAVDEKSLPPTQVLGPDEKGIKTIIEYRWVPFLFVEHFQAPRLNWILVRNIAKHIAKAFGNGWSGAAHLMRYELRR